MVSSNIDGDREWRHDTGAAKHPCQVTASPASGGQFRRVRTGNAEALEAMKSTGSEAQAQEEDPAAGSGVSELRPARRAGDRDEQGSGGGDDVGIRMDRLERSNRRLRMLVVALLLAVVYVLGSEYVHTNPIVRQQLMESHELKLLDNAGNARLFLRMFSKVPVLQILDGNGKPRLSLGLRFDDTPFIDLSDKTGRTRATFEMTEQDEPTLRLFDENGETSFKIH